VLSGLLCHSVRHHNGVGLRNLLQVHQRIGQLPLHSVHHLDIVCNLPELCDLAQEFGCLAESYLPYRDIKYNQGSDDNQGFTLSIVL
jgi:hypothetical protein